MLSKFSWCRQVLWLLGYDILFCIYCKPVSCLCLPYCNTFFCTYIDLHFMFDAMFPMQITNISRGQRQVIHQLDNLTNLLHEHLVLTRQANAVSRNRVLDTDAVICPLICLTVASVGYFVYKGFSRGWPKWIGQTGKHAYWGLPSSLAKNRWKPTFTTDLQYSRVQNLDYILMFLSCKLKKDSPRTLTSGWPYI